MAMEASDAEARVLATATPVSGGASSIPVTSGSDGTACVVVAPGTYALSATFPLGKVVSGSPYLPNVNVTSCQTRQATPVEVCIGQRISAFGTGNQSCTCVVNYYDMLGSLVGTGSFTLVYNASTNLSGAGGVIHMSPELLDGTREIIWPDPGSSSTSTTPDPVWTKGFLVSTGGIYPRPCATPP